MKNLVGIIIIVIVVFSCGNSKNLAISENSDANQTKKDTIRIANEELEYEIIIIEIGFDSWLVTQRPMTFYSQWTLEFKNRSNVIEWNQRVNQPNLYSTLLYEQMIDYQSNIDYGMEVNYMLYMYLKYFQKKYDQRLIYVK